MKHSVFGIAMKMLFYKKQRLFLTCMGIAVSIGLMIVITSLYASMERSVQKTIDKEFGIFDLMVGYSPYNDSESKKLLTKDEIAQLRNMDGVIDSGIAIVSPERLTNENSDTKMKDGINYFGVEPNQLNRTYFGFKTKIEPNEMVITDNLAKRWEVKQGDVKEFSINNHRAMKMVVAEIIPDYTSGSAVIMNIEAVRRAYSLGEVANAIYLDIAEDISEKSVEEKIRSEMDEHLDIALRSEDKTVMKQRTMFRFISIGLGSLLLLVSMLFITSSYKLILLGRVRELSTFRMNGASRRVIYKMVMLEAAVMNVIGVGLGVGVGVTLCHLSTIFIDSMMGTSVNSADIDWLTVSVIALLSWLLLTMSLMKLAYTVASDSPLVSVRTSEQENLRRYPFWIAGALIVSGFVLLCLAWFDIISSQTQLLFTLVGGLLVAVGCILNTGYMIPFISHTTGWLIQKFAVPEAYYAIKQFITLRRQNSFIVMLLASIVTALIAIPTFIDNLNHSGKQQVIRKHITPIVIEKKVDVMSSNILDQVRQVKGVREALPMGTFHGVLLADLDYTQADADWLKQNEYHPDYLEGTSLYETYEYEWLGVAKTDLNLMKQMGLLEAMDHELSSGIIIQSAYANHMGLSSTDTLSLQKTRLGEKLEQYELPIKGVTELSITTQETHALVDINNLNVSWIGNEGSDEQASLILPRTIYVQVNEDADIATVREALQQRFEDDPLVKVTDADSELERLANESREQYIILWAVMSVFIVVGVVGVMNTLGAAFHTHRREYAILRAIRLTASKLRSVMIIQGLLYAVTSIVIGLIASAWIIVGLFSGGSDELKDWTINGSTIALPVCIVGAISLLISVIYAKQFGQKSITEELTVE
ncbi:FtsX-like permease family protein [Marinicrinis sediminis]|uniref:FtsX-like permease family protein n=1 Tax=Marinicrinis sediminis TaxID=1652465 RepID=A0ABW5R8Z5_9BACL